MKWSGFRSLLPATLPVIEEDLIPREIPQGFGGSSKPFSCGRKQTNSQDAQIYSQHEVFENLCVMDTKDQTLLLQQWKKASAFDIVIIVTSMTDAVSHLFMEWKSWLSSSKTSLSLGALDTRVSRNHLPITALSRTSCHSKLLLYLKEPKYQPVKSAWKG